MPDNTSPSASPEPGISPAEFDFATSATPNPRIKKRSLKAKKADATTAAKADLPHEAPPRSAANARPEYKPSAEHDADAEINAQVRMTDPTPSRPTSKPSPAATTRPTSSTASTSPHGTRPATLYYSTGVRKDKEEPAPMKTTTTASPATSSASLSSTTTRPAASTTRPASISDYRANAERQSREQKSVGDILSYIVYGLVGLFVLGALLAGYGTYVLSEQIKGQSVTINGLQQHFESENRDLTVKLATTVDNLAQAQAQIGRQQQLIVQQQDTINKLLNATSENAGYIRQERQTRAEETASIRARLKDLEYQNSTTRRY